MLHYSGHGSNVPDKRGDEADHRDEILCPTDLDWKAPLLDDWLRTTFDTLNRGVNLTVIVDCCHSATNTRMLAMPDAPVIERFLPCPLDMLAAESGRDLKRAKTRTSLRRSTPAKRRQDVAIADIPEVLITDCRDTQTSADGDIKGTFNGALTYCLTKAIKEAGGHFTYRELHQRTVALLKQSKFDQVPQIEGARPQFRSAVSLSANLARLIVGARQDAET